LPGQKLISKIRNQLNVKIIGAMIGYECLGKIKDNLPKTERNNETSKKIGKKDKNKNFISSVIDGMREAPPLEIFSDKASA
jgi:hypothetical protein